MVEFDGSISNNCLCIDIFMKAKTYFHPGDRERWDKNGTKLFENFVLLSDANRSQRLLSGYFWCDLRHQLSRVVKSDGGSSPPFGITQLLGRKIS
jgi:hypothetical protein